jgi:hypothetical protein
VAQVLENYEIDDETASSDVRAFLNKLKEMNII